MPQAHLFLPYLGVLSCVLCCLCLAIGVLAHSDPHACVCHPGSGQHAYSSLGTLAARTVDLDNEPSVMALDLVSSVYGPCVQPVCA